MLPRSIKSDENTPTQRMDGYLMLQRNTLKVDVFFFQTLHAWPFLYFCSADIVAFALSCHILTLSQAGVHTEGCVLTVNSLLSLIAKH